jgi:hypothetical protein
VVLVLPADGVNHHGISTMLSNMCKLSLSAFKGSCIRCNLHATEFCVKCNSSHVLLQLGEVSHVSVILWSYLTTTARSCRKNHNRKNHNLLAMVVVKRSPSLSTALLLAVAQACRKNHNRENQNHKNHNLLAVLEEEPEDLAPTLGPSSLMDLTIPTLMTPACDLKGL